MKVIKDVPQGSCEWLDLRMGKATASNFSRIITGGGKRSESLSGYAIELAGEVLACELEDSFKSSHMQRGNDLEDDAIEAYQEETFNLVETVSFIDCGDYGCSPDGLVGNSGMIEAKSPMQKVHAKYLWKNELPTIYKQQVQGGLYVSERDWCDFISYNPTLIDGLKIFVKRIYRDDLYIKKLERFIEELIDKRDYYLTEIKRNTAYEN